MLTRFLLLVLTTFCLQNIYAEPPVAICHKNTVVPVFQNTNYFLQAFQLDNDSYSKQHLDLSYSFSTDVNDTIRTITCADTGQMSVVLYVHDSQGEYDSCVTEVEVQSICTESQEINGIIDTIAPYLLVESDFEPFNLDSVSFGQLPARDFNIGSYDNVTGKRDIEFSYSKDFDVEFFYHHCDDPEVQEVTIYARDEAGNISWVVIEVLNKEINCDLGIPDETAPNAICRDSIILPLNVSNKTATLEAEALNLGSEDDITPEVKLEFSFSDTDVNDKTRLFSCADKGENLITLYVYDHEGNIGSCETRVMISDLNNACRDEENPIASCRANVNSILGASQSVDIEAKEFDGGSSDDITIEENLRFSFSDDINDTIRSYGCDDLGTYSITIYVWDEAGKNDSCTSELIVEDINNVCIDTESPLAECAQNLEYEVLSKSETYEIIASELNNGSSDNETDEENLIFSFSSDITDTVMTYDCSSVGVVTAVLYVTDEAGNSSTCDAEISITDPNDVCFSSIDYAYQGLIKVFPNPTTGVLTLDALPITEGVLSIQVKNLLGQSIFEAKCETTRKQLELEAGPGIYLVHVESSNGDILMIQKLIIK